MTPPESPEVVGARAIAYSAERRAEIAASEEWAAQGAPSPDAAEHARAVVRYTPVSLAVAPFVPWDDPAAGLALAAALASIVAAVEGAHGEVNAIGAGRPAAVEFDADRYVSGAR